MDDKIVIALRLDCAFKSIVNWLDNYCKRLENQSIVIRKTAGSSDTKCRMYLLLKDNENNIGPEDDYGYSDFLNRWYSIQESDVKIASIEVIYKSTEDILFLMRLKRSEYQNNINTFFQDFVPEFFPTKNAVSMIDQAVIDELGFGMEEKIRELFNRHKTYEEIAINIGVSESTLKRVLKKMGLSRQKKI
jgi:hypothetical protein